MFRMIYEYNAGARLLRELVKVYDISYSADGSPLFLICLQGIWVRKSAKYFKPISAYTFLSEEWGDSEIVSALGAV